MNLPTGSSREGWRNQASIVGRGDYRCDICQGVITDDDEDSEMLDGQRVHYECAKAEGEL